MTYLLSDYLKNMVEYCERNESTLFTYVLQIPIWLVLNEYLMNYFNQVGEQAITYI